MTPKMICPDCGQVFNPLCMGAAEFHSGQCTSQSTPAKSKKKSWGHYHTALVLREKLADTRRELQDTRKALQEALGCAKEIAG